MRRRRQRSNVIPWGIAGYGFLFIFIIIGIIALFTGIKGRIKLTIETRNYKSVDGTFIDSRIKSNYDPRDDGTPTYHLIYSYTVNGENYTMETDYSTSQIPRRGSIRTLKYNPKNPSEAIVPGISYHEVFMFMGMGFILIPVIGLTKPSHELYED